MAQERGTEQEEAREPGETPAAEESEEGPGGPYVVGIGASAGGLEALRELVQHVPMDDMAFVIVQHLDPHHESFLTQLLSRSSKVEVVVAQDGAPAEPNRVYVIPPNADLALRQGVLRIIPPSDGRPRLPVDHFFRSLALDKGPSAIGVILSGTGTDGTLGLRAIKEGGGITFVQDPGTARYDGMPRSALNMGVADFCLSPKAIGEELARIARPSKDRRARTPKMREQITRLLILLRSAFGNDLTRYKSSTIERRIERRMTLKRIGSLHDYVSYVQSNPDELRALYKDMLIAVTSFFRDHEPFELLQRVVFSRLVERKDHRLPIRIWVPACSTGEEAYSIAIALLEVLGDQISDHRIQIFGTDIDEESINRARRGAYPFNIEQDVSPERLKRFFVRRESDYQIARRVRELVVFSRQNLLRDAPFSRMDLVSCRNLLIYLQPTAQRKVLNVLHYALNRDGYLMLGTSETVGDAPELFSLVDRKNKIYSKRNIAPAPALDEVLIPEGAQLRRQPPAERPIASLQAIADRKVLEVYGPPGVMINENLDILHFRGQTGPYLNPSPGAASFSLLRLARPELHLELKRGVAEAFSTDRRVSCEATFYEEGRSSAVRLDIVPLLEPDTRTRCLLVSFLRLESPPETVPIVAETEQDGRIVALARRIQDLERELEVTKDYLQSTLEDKESANEELKSANEELQSSNEELQSTNEELETSREELQSSNEELTTVNEELQNRMTELSQTNDDLHNLLAGLDSTVLIVDMDLRIRRYTASAERLLNLVAADVGRSIEVLDPFCGVDMRDRVSQVIESLSIAAQELLCRNQRWYTLRIAPYRTLDHIIRGAVITLEDIDIRKRAEALTRDVGDYASRFLGAIHHPLIMVDAKLRIVWANDAYYSRFQVVPEETLGNAFPRASDPTLGPSGIRPKLEEALRSGQILRDFRVGDADGRTLLVGAGRVPLAGDSPMLLISIEEERK